MLFFILVVAAVVGIAVYVTKKTKHSSHIIPTTPPIVHIPGEQPTQGGEIDLGIPNPPKFDTPTGETEIIPIEVEPVATNTPKMSAKSKKPKPVSKSKTTKKSK